MLEPIILSDEDEDPKTPLPSVSKKARTGPDPIFPTIFVLDDDPTPLKPGPNTTVTASASTPSFVAETPMSDLSIRFSGNDQRKLSDKGRNGVISLESENEDGEETVLVQGSKLDDAFGCADWSQISDGSSSQGAFSFDHIDQVRDHPDKENFRIEELENNVQPNAQNRLVPSKKDGTQGAVGKKKISKEERARIMEEKKLMKEQEKLQKAAMKAQAAELKKLEKEKEKWAKGKFALKSIVAEFDTKVVEQGSIGGHLLTMFADKGLKYRITSNPIERSVVWTITVPEHISQLSPEGMEIRYVLLVYEAEEFCNLLINQSFLDHVSRVRSRYPSYTVCYLTNRLMAYIHKMEKEQYKNPENDNGWRRPPIEKELAKLTTHFLRVHYRMCIDEAEVAEHVVGLTCSLATCQFRKKLTRLSVNANGSLVPKDFIDRDLIKKSPWLKALVAIPKVQPRFAIAIWKKYPTMKSLLRVYMDPNKMVHEKECLLEDLTTEGLLGGERRVGRICSKRVYRILMAQSGSIKTDDVEDGADFFEQSS